MLDELPRHLGLLFFASSFGSLLAVAFLEVLLERRPLAHSTLRRWVSNVALTFLDRAVVRWWMPIGTFAVALWSAEQGFGLLHWLPLPELASVVVTLVLFDLASYAIHRLDHAVPLLWRLHSVHHSDLDLDFSTTHRHHPFETLIAATLRLGTTALIGAAPIGVVLYSLLRGPVDAFAHGNLRVPDRVDRAFRWLFVTPGMHAVHHSATREETDANFGGLLSVWDRLFGSYREAPAAGYGGMTIGLERFRSARDLDLDRMLVQPFWRTTAPSED